jgi:hypothetical protein
MQAVSTATPRILLKLVTSITHQGEGNHGAELQSVSARKGKRSSGLGRFPLRSDHCWRIQDVVISLMMVMEIPGASCISFAVA